MNTHNNSKFSQFKKVLFRKSIHIFGFLVIIISIEIGIIPAALLIVSLGVTYSISEHYRLKGRAFPLFTTITTMAMRNDIGGENQKVFVKAPLYFAAGILASLLIFPAPFNYVAIAVVTLGDGFASVVGRMFGKHKIPHTGGKSLEGTIAGVFCAFAGALIFVSPMTAIAAALAGMGVELLRLRVSDNLTIPIVSGLTAMVVSNNL